MGIGPVDPRPGVDEEPERLNWAGDWHPLGCWAAAVRELLAGRPAEADRLLQHGELVAETLDSHLPRSLCLGLLAGLALLDRRSADGAAHAERALAALSLVDRENLPLTALPRSAVAAVQAANGEQVAARRSLVLAGRLSAAAHGTAPRYSVLCMVFQARAGLFLRDLPAARTLLRAAEQSCDDGVPSPFLRACIDGTRKELAERSNSGGYGFPALTTAELRVLQHLPTQLSFPEIAGGLFVSRHTVKTQALAIYHKLGVSSRTAAVEQARAFGLLPAAATG